MSSLQVSDGQPWAHIEGLGSALRVECCAYHQQVVWAPSRPSLPATRTTRIARTGQFLQRREPTPSSLPEAFLPRSFGRLATTFPAVSSIRTFVERNWLTAVFAAPIVFAEVLRDAFHPGYARRSVSVMPQFTDDTHCSVFILFDEDAFRVRCRHDPASNKFAAIRGSSD